MTEGSTPLSEAEHLLPWQRDLLARGFELVDGEVSARRLIVRLPRRDSGKRLFLRLAAALRVKP